MAEAMLQEMFPALGAGVLRKALQDHGEDLERAVCALTNGCYDEPKDALSQLQQMFPAHPREVLERALRQYHDTSSAAIAISRDEMGDISKVTTPSTPPAAGKVPPTHTLQYNRAASGGGVATALFSSHASEPPGPSAASGDATPPLASPPSSPLAGNGVLAKSPSFKESRVSGESKNRETNTHLLFKDSPVPTAIATASSERDKGSGVILLDSAPLSTAPPKLPKTTSITIDEQSENQASSTTTITISSTSASTLAPAPAPAPAAALASASVSAAVRPPRLQKMLSQGDRDFAVDTLHAIFPTASIEKVDGILSTITGEPAHHDTGGADLSAVEMLATMFPVASRERLQRCLESTAGNVNDAASLYLQQVADADGASEVAVTGSSPAKKGGGGAAAATSSHTSSSAAPRLSKKFSQGDGDCVLRTSACAENALKDVSPLDMLVAMFPTALRAELQLYLERTDGSVDDAAAAYLQSVADGEAARVAAEAMTAEMDKEDAALAKFEADRHAAAMAYTSAGRHAPGWARARRMYRKRARDYDESYYDEEEDDEEEYDEEYDYEDGVAAAGAAPMFPGISLARHGGMAKTASAAKRMAPSFDIDVSKQAQSFLCAPSPHSAITQIKVHIGTDDLAPLVARCFQQMVEREQQHWDDYVVFYHSYSFAAILYEVQAAIARAIYDLPMDFAPLPRLLKKPFDGRPALDMLVADFKRMTGQDHNPEFRAVAISVSCSMLGLGSEAPPVSCFRAGYSCTDLSFREALENILRACGLDTSQVESVADDIVEVSNRFGLGGNYASLRPRPATKKSARGRCRFGAPAAFAPFTMPTAHNGHMLQIFVHKDVVDDIAYRSHPMGVPIPDTNPISAFLRGESLPVSSEGGGGGGGGGRGRGGHRAMMSVAARAAGGAAHGQARLFMHPSIFTDPKKSIVYHYCANVNFMDPSPDATLNRAAYLNELQRVLAPIIGSPEALKRAYLGVEARHG